ncbi:MAG: hypothetical protein ACXVXQ_08905 [Mycobacteriaceae bacterium]
MAGGARPVPAVWLLQAMAAFPRRSEPAPGLVYICDGFVLLAFIWFAAARGTRRIRRLLLFPVALSSVVAVLVTVAYFPTDGAIWQGRYGLPFSMGFFLLGGLALERARPAHRLLPAACVSAGVLLSIAQVASVLRVLAMERRVSPSIAAGLWHPPSMARGCACHRWLHAGAARRGPDALSRRHAPARHRRAVIHVGDGKRWYRPLTGQIHSPT